ncbi:MAG: site-specific integrase [Clostridia bacterium]|nr:site-specific integrase [Clostridia bacterium]
MTDQEITYLQNFILQSSDDEEKDKALVIALKAAADSVELRNLKKLNRENAAATKGNSSSKGKVIFTTKELETMPDSIKRILIINEKVVNYRFYNGVYQIRYHRDGYDIEVASKSLEVAKQKFLTALSAGTRRGKPKMPTFKEFSDKWLSLKEPLIKPRTFMFYTRYLNFYIDPVLGEMKIDEITRDDVQTFLNKLIEDGIQSTAEKCKIVLGAVFDLAVEDYDIKNPMTKIMLPHYEAKKGKAFSKDEEKTLLQYCKGHPKTKGVSAIIILLYTGMRFGELESMTHDDRFIYCISEKTRKGYADVQRKIPISPMLKKVLDLVDMDFGMVSQRTLTDILKPLFPEHHIHELRYTFITRAKECGVNTELVMLMDGHKYDADCKSSTVDRGYTDFSDEFFLKEMEKFDYEL